MGNWSNDILDDFTLPDGRLVPLGNLDNFEAAHKDFAINWLLDDRNDEYRGESLFKRENGKSSSYYSNRTFVPEWKKRAQDIIPPDRYVTLVFTRQH